MVCTIVQVIAEDTGSQLWGIAGPRTTCFTYDVMLQDALQQRCLTRITAHHIYM